MNDSTADTEQHIRKVQARLEECVNHLTVRAAHHDASKLREPEKSGFDTLTERLSMLVYGSDEYRAALEAGKATIQHHYAVNTHHPESTRTREEKWRAIAGFEGYYEVSNFGDVRSVDRTVPREGTRGDMLRKGQVRKPHVTPKGYLRVQLTQGGEPRSFQVHRLVAEAFIPNPENKPEVNHRNGNKRDNYLGNLEWATSSENMTHAYALGLKKPMVKYVVHCEELDITTFGTEKMERELRARGYEKAESAAIWNCIAGDKHSHLGLTFTSVNVEDYRPESDIRFFSLLDLVECLCDWKAASERTAGGSLAQSLPINKERFDISDQLYAILENTVRELGW